MEIRKQIEEMWSRIASHQDTANAEGYGTAWASMVDAENATSAADAARAAYAARNTVAARASEAAVEAAEAYYMHSIITIRGGTESHYAAIATNAAKRVAQYIPA